MRHDLITLQDKVNIGLCNNKVQGREYYRASIEKVVGAVTEHSLSSMKIEITLEMMLTCLSE
jgi:hypothetical protein